MTQLSPMPGNARAKRKQWSRKRIMGQELKFSIKKQKKQFQRKVRNGKSVELPQKGNSYRKIPNPAAKWELVS